MQVQGDNSYGRLQPNITTLIGHLYFDSHALCASRCYTGLQPPHTHSQPLPNLDEIDDRENSLIYDHWLSTFSLRPVQASKQLFETFDMDLKLIAMFRDRLISMEHQNTWFRSALKLYVKRDLEFRDEEDEEEEEFESRRTHVSFSFPMKFKFEWPRLIKNPQPIIFERTQVLSSWSVREVSVQNPSNESLVVQALLLNSYPQPAKMLELIRARPDWFSGVPSKLNEDEEPDEQPFSLIPTSGVRHFQQRLLKLISATNTVPHKSTVALLVPPNHVANLQIQFKPNKVKKKL